MSDQLVLNYLATRSKEDRDRVLVAFLPLIERVARAMKTPPHVEVGDLVGYGVFGLIVAADTFDPEREVTFSTYASSVIRGRIREELRRADWATKTARQRATQHERIVERLQQELGRDPTAEEVATELGIDMEALAKLRGAMSRMTQTSFRGVNVNERSGNGAYELRPGGSPKALMTEHDQAADAELLLGVHAEQISDAIDALDEPERTIALLYYVQGKTMAQIGSICGVAPSRIQSMHTAAVEKVKERLAQRI